MITETKTYVCRKCQSTNLKKNGTTRHGKQKFACKDCGAYGSLELTPFYTQEEKDQILKAYQERSSMRGIQRIFGTSPRILKQWLKKNSPTS